MPNSQFRNLVFEGGGVLGIAYAGALRVLQKKGIMPDIERVAGASAGAITASLLAIGYDADGIQDVVAKTSFNSFMDAPGGFFRSLVRAFRSYGWFAGDSFSEWMKERITMKGLPEGLTFKQLEALAEDPANVASTAPGKFRKLYVVASDISRGLVVQYDANETPDMPIWKAVRSSMSIPFFFSSVQEKFPSKAESEQADEEGDGKVLLVDGGVTWNYPIDLFDDKRFIQEAHPQDVSADPKQVGIKSTYDDGHVYNKQTLGFRVDSADEVQEYKNRLAAKRKPIKNIVAYSMSLIQFMRGIANGSHLKKYDWHRTIFLDDAGIPFTDFDLNPNDIRTLVANGEQGCIKYFEWFEREQRAPGDERPVNKAD